ncbi:MAG: hypothetical protein WDM79_04900 [Terricaulis sp.]
MPFHRPYADESVDTIYNLLFCDDAALFTGIEDADAIWAEAFDEDALRAIADDAGAPSRIRALAFNRLRENSADVAPKHLFGMIVEVPLDGGLDTLAAYEDGSVRYINRSGKMSIFETEIPPLADKVKALLAGGQGIVDAIGPWEEPRLPAPSDGNVRMSFVVSDGLYSAKARTTISCATIWRRPSCAPPAIFWWRWWI